MCDDSNSPLVGSQVAIARTCCWLRTNVVQIRCGNILEGRTAIA
jgi:hypothetical protein